MFYSHEILTSREGGVATVWLVATLGSKSNLKKVNRKAILEVNIQKTCDIIIAPEAPMALRLQSNLLYGVSRVYSQQCGYVLNDAQTAQSNMKQLLKSLRTSELDPEAGKARPDQLMIQDDPDFLPELALPGLDIDLSALDISTDASSRRSSLLSPHSQRSSISSTYASEDLSVVLNIPSSGTGGGGSFGSLDLPGDDRSSAQRLSRMRSIFDEDEGPFDPNPGWTFNEQGEIEDTDARAPAQPESATRPGPVRLGSDSAASARVRQEIEEAMQANQFDNDQMNLDLDIDLPPFDNNQDLLPEAEAFPPIQPQAPAPTGFLGSSSEILEESSESAEAPARRRKAAPKYFGMDEQKSLRNNDLASWNNNYIANMAEAAQVKQQHKLPTLAKKNAAFFVYGSGIGGVGLSLGGSRFSNPLGMFAGDKLMAALTGITPPVTGRKRSHAEDEVQETDSEGRRVRAREDDGDQLGRGDNIALEDDTMDMGRGMDVDEEDVEVGRHAVPALEDYSSQMPWNTTASVRASRAGSIARGAAGSLGGGYSGSFGGGFPSSVGQPGSAIAPGAPIPGSHDRRSRLTSASPLVGRGRQRFSSIPIHEGDDDLTFSAGDDFELYGPAAGVPTQQAAESQWMRTTLDTESNNFLGFMKTQIMSKVAVAAEGEDELAGKEGAVAPEMAFEELLPPARHSKVVAAQALHHILALATKGLISVSQWEDYGPIVLGIGAGV